MSNQEHEISIQQDQILYSIVPTGDSTDTNVAFETFYQQWYLYVASRMRTLLRAHPDEIENGMQETWFKIWRSPPRNNDHIPAWIYRITQNVACDIMRKVQKRDDHSFSLDPVLLDEQVMCEDVQSYIPERLDRQAMLADIWARLPKRERQALADYINHKPVNKGALYLARRKCKDMRRTARKRQARMEASA